jgi:hypothetical protein
MDITSFILGMCSVAITCVFVFTVYTLINMKRKINEFRVNMNSIRPLIDTIADEFSNFDARIKVLMDEWHRNMDAPNLNKSTINSLEKKINDIQDQINSIKNDMLMIPKTPSPLPVFPDYEYPTWSPPPIITCYKTDFISSAIIK